MSKVVDQIADANPRRFRPYAKRRESGIAWLGQVPEDWTILPAGRLIRRIEQGWSPVAEERPAGPHEWAVIKLSAVNKGRFRSSEHKTLPSDLSPDERLELREGDFLLTRSNTPELVGDVCVVRADRPRLLLCDLVYRLQLESGRIDPHFLAYWFMSPAGRFQIEVDARGSSQSMVKISRGLIRAWAVLLPPAEQQRSIVAFLDRETAMIDALVAQKERVIELLQEKRTALITQAVTRGLNPNAPVSDSGVEWLGEVPAHWEAARMWQISRAMSGGTPSKGERAYWDGEIPWVSPKDMKRRLIDSSVDCISERALEETGIRLFPPPVVLFVVRGMILAHSFPVAVTTVPVTINQDMKALVLDDKIDPYYLAWVLEGVGKEIGAAIVEEAAHGTRAIRMDEWRTVEVPVPPRTEQRSIATFLDRETVKIDSLIETIRQAIAHLKELRNGLISAAVTGKIDVREEAA